MFVVLIVQISFVGPLNILLCGLPAFEANTVVV